MQRDEPGQDDETWRSIVENYGDRADLGDDPVSAPAPAPAPPALPETPAPAAQDQDLDRFIAPDPPLPPRPTRDRLLAWVGMIATPLVVLTLVIFDIAIPSLLAYALVAAFVGGFGYLVAHLPRTPEDPWDDGARL